VDLSEEEIDMGRSMMRPALLATAAAAATLAMLAPQALATTKNVNFLGTWKTNNNQPFTIKKENRKTGACSGTTSLSKIGGYRLVACHVKGNHYAFTITLGAGYKSLNTGTITGNKLMGSFRDTNGATGVYSAVRT
jgi:hypothetical protein